MASIPPMLTNKHKQGFSLIEVLIALTIIAIALGAILSTSGTQASSVAYLKQKTIAHWVAANELTRLNVEKRFPDVGTSTGTSEMANFEWFWSREVQKTENLNTRQVTYTIYLDKRRENNVTSLTGYAFREENEQ